jgi:general secretion pathway protein I
MRRARGFSLLEVMVALAIFGLMITGILAAQAGLAASNKKAANMGVASTLARCKMTELEEKLIKMGYPEIDDIETGASCCDGQEIGDYTCDTKVQRVTMPDPPRDLGAEGGDGGFLNPLGATPGSSGGIGSGTLDFDAGLGDMGNQLNAQTGGKGTAGLLNMVMGFVYPSMKGMMEASIRRITVSVHWSEGRKPQELQVVQFVTNPQRGGFLGGPLAAPGGSAAPGGTGTTGTTSGAPAATGATGFGPGRSPFFPGGGPGMP